MVEGAPYVNGWTSRCGEGGAIGKDIGLGRDGFNRDGLAVVRQGVFVVMIPRLGRGYEVMFVEPLAFREHVSVRGDFERQNLSKLWSVTVCGNLRNFPC